MEYIKQMKIDPIDVGGMELNTLRIDVRYSKRDISVFDGSMIEGGIKVYIKPIAKGMYGYTCMYDGNPKHQGFTILAVPMQRRSHKKIDKVVDKVEPLADTIKEMFENDEFEEIKNLILKACQNI